MKTLSFVLSVALLSGCYLDDKFTGHLAGTDGGSACGDTQSDSANCGSCGHDCATLPNVAQGSAVSCVAGKCVVPQSACASGFAHCSSLPDDGCEADLSQPSHCGSCSACLRSPAMAIA